MVYSASDITATVPGMTGLGNGVAQKIAGNADNSADPTMNFMDFILARITALQSTQTDLEQITDKATGKTASLLSPSDSALITIAEFLTPTDETNPEMDIKLSDLSEEAKLALKELSGALLEMSENGQTELSEEQIAALETLHDLIVNPEIDVTAVTEEDDNDNIIIEHGGKKIIIPVILTKLFANSDTDTPEAALDNNAVINRIITNLEKIAATIDHETADETVMSEAELALAMNAIEPSDSAVGDDTDIQNNTNGTTANGQIPPVTADLTGDTGIDTGTVIDVDVAANNADDGKDSGEENGDTDETVIAVAVEAPRTINPTAEDGADDTLAALTKNTAVPAPLTGDSNKTDRPNSPHHSANGESDDALFSAATKSDKTAAKPANGSATSAKANFAATLAGTNAPATVSADMNNTDTLDALDTLKSADTLIQNDAKANLLKGTTILTRSIPTPAAQQVSMQIYKAAVKGDTRITIKLHPEELGKVDVKLEMTRDGKAKATVYADNSDTLNLLSRNASQLQKALNDAGLQAQGGDLSFHLNDGNNAQTSSQDKNGHHKGGAAQTNNTIETDIPLTSDVLIGEYSVNYKV